jgi:8-amino-7-oxononanoate synthase
MALAGYGSRGTCGTCWPPRRGARGGRPRRLPGAGPASTWRSVTKHARLPTGQSDCAAAPAFSPWSGLDDFTSNPFPALDRRGLAAPAPGSLLDTPEARSWFELIEWGTAASLYTCQLPLQRASRPDSQSLGEEITLFSSYGYAGLNGHPRINAAAQRAIEVFGTSAGGARMLTGTLELHLELERELATFLRQEAATTYCSGYDANIAAVGALFGPQDCVILDQLAHRSLFDAVRMAGCTSLTFRHNDLVDLEAAVVRARATGCRRLLLVVDGVYSMDGDEAPLAELVDLKHRHAAFLLVDESHAVGAVGASGRGTWEKQGVDPRDIDLVTGSLGKAIASAGGFVAGSHQLKVLLQHASAPSFFSGALSPANSAAILESLRVIQDEPQHLVRLRANTRVLRDGLMRLGVRLGPSTTAIVPLLLGDEVRAFWWARRLLDQGVAVSAVAHPAVPRGSARLRLCATGAHRPRHFARLFDAVRTCLQEEQAEVGTTG